MLDGDSADKAAARGRRTKVRFGRPFNKWSCLGGGLRALKSTLESEILTRYALTACFRDSCRLAQRGSGSNGHLGYIAYQSWCLRIIGHQPDITTHEVSCTTSSVENKSERSPRARNQHSSTNGRLISRDKGNSFISISWKCHGPNPD